MTATRLQRDIADRVMSMIAEDCLDLGHLLNESDVARRLGVSRTPVRAAFDQLAESGWVRRQVNKGIEILKVPDEDSATTRADPIEAVMVTLAHDHENRAFADEFSEQDVLRRYRLQRSEVRALLERLADLDLIERKPGYGWRFLHPPQDAALHIERYRFRMIVEPMALMEPGFHLEETWIDDMRKRHQETISQPWRDGSSVNFFEMNAEFHEGIAVASNNRLIVSTIKRLNKVRRMSNYDWIFGFEPVVVSCNEHISVLDAIARGDNELASAHMKSHLRRAGGLRHGRRGLD